MVQMTIGKPIGAGSGKISALNFSGDDAARLAGDIEQRYLATVSGSAAGYCIDGRLCKETLGGTMPEIGPSVAGGPTITAYAAAEMVGDYFGQTSGPTSLARVNEVDAVLADAGIALGAHVSRAAADATRRTFVDVTGQSKTGCGANDEFRSILSCLSDSADAVYGTTNSLLSEAFAPAAMHFTEDAVLLKRVAGYRSNEVLQAIAAPAQGKNIEILDGDHAETLVVFNYVADTTVDRDVLVTETGKQVFVVDMWYIDKLAHAMAHGRPDALEMYMRLRHAMVAFQIATYLTLCDGTHRPVLLKQLQTQQVPALAR